MSLASQQLGWRREIFCHPLLGPVSAIVHPLTPIVLLLTLSLY